MTWTETGGLSWVEWETLNGLIDSAQQSQEQPTSGRAARKARRQQLQHG